MDLIELGVPREAIEDFCRRHHIRRLSVFGSTARADARPNSDVDVLVEFQPGEIVGLRIFDVEDDLSRLLGGRRVDLVNPKYLNRHLRGPILASAKVQYAEG